MSQVQDKVREDLRRFMSDEPQDNIADVRTMVKVRLVVTDKVKIIPLSHKDSKKDLFSNDLNKKISRVRPEYMVRLVGLIFCGLAFGMMAGISIVVVDYPYNLALVPIALAPFTIAVVRRIRRGYRVSRNKREFL